MAYTGLQVKEFINHQHAQDTVVNEWLEEQGETIEVVDIKYSVGALQGDSVKGWDAQEFSGIVIVYRNTGIL